MSKEEWVEISPHVNQEAEFLEIAGDFGDPMELFREALHNAIDWHATEFHILIKVETINGREVLVIEMSDNGDGMNYEKITGHFWDLGNSASVGDNTKIGEKGHGTKIYLRSDRIIVHTSDGTESYEAICDGAFASLNAKKIHKPRVRKVDEDYAKGTKIRIEGYNLNDMGQYRQNIIKDYLYWKTKLGSFENQLEGRAVPDFKVYLQALDVSEPEELKFGHVFAEECKDVNKLFRDYEESAVDYYVKKYIYQDQSLASRPDIKYDIVIYVEGDAAKRSYNPMLAKQKSKVTGAYKVSDRYGIWLCKDYVPIQRVNEWISGFGTGSNSVVMLHGFINCQRLRLTANRGSVANTDPMVVNELKSALAVILNEIDVDLYKNDIYVLKQWQQEQKTKEVEKAAFQKRQHLINTKKYFMINGRTFLEPRNEAELYGLFMSLYTLYPDKFDFEPLDYDESIGVDLVARNKTDNKISECEYWYVELKYMMSTKEFNHSFQNIRKIVCWSIADSLKDGSEVASSAGDKNRVFHMGTDSEGRRVYFLDSNDSALRISVIVMKEFVTDILGIEIKEQR